MSMSLPVRPAFLAVMSTFDGTPPLTAAVTGRFGRAVIAAATAVASAVAVMPLETATLTRAPAM
jgi:hypothetical protein